MKPVEKATLATTEPVGLSSASLTLLTAALWGGTTVAIKYGLESVEPVAMAGFRFAIASVFMLFWCRWERTSLKLDRGQLGLAVWAGVLLFFQISLFNIGVQRSNASHGAMLINTFVFWVVLIEHFVTKSDRLTASKAVGLTIAAAGVVWILLQSDATSTEARHPDQPTLIGDIALVASAMMLAVKVVFIKHSLKTMEPGKIILWHNALAVPLFAAYSLMWEAPPRSLTTAATLGIFYQGVMVAGFCFALHARLLRKHSASQLAVFSFATPLFGIALASVSRDDPLSPWLLVSAAGVAAGIFLVNRASRAQRTMGSAAADA